MANNNKLQNIDIINLANKISPYSEKMIINFLKEIYVNLSKRCARNFNSYTFQEILNIPMVISDKIFSFLIEKGKRLLSINEFANGFYHLFFETIEQKIYFAFEIFDFSKDGIIHIENVKLLLTHFHLINNSNETLNYLYKIIDVFFHHQTEMHKSECYEWSYNKNADVPILFIIYINKYALFFNHNELKYYLKISKFSQGNSSEKSDDKLTKTEQSNFKISNELIEYAQLFIGVNYEENEESELSDDLDDDLKDIEDLDIFEKDLNDVFHMNSSTSFLTHQNTYSPGKSFTFSFYKILTKDSNINNLLLPRKTITSNNICLLHDDIRRQNKTKSEFAQKSTFCSSSQDETHLSGRHLPRNKSIHCLFNTSHNKSKFFKSSNSLPKVINKSTSSEIKKKYNNELYIFKGKTRLKNQTAIKMVIIGRYIFYFKKIKEHYTFKKIIPTMSLFPKKAMINKSNMQLILISTIHNYNKQYLFIGDNFDEINNFINLINRANKLSDIGDDYKFRYELGKGSFGHVVLAEKKEDNSELDNIIFAIKIINKSTSSEEEYKINRWESSLFSILKNINHLNIITCYEKYETDKNFFFVYEYIEGSDLKTYIKLNSNVNIVDIAFQIIQAMGSLHKYGIIHRDLKTTNILIDHRRKIVKIIDFGLSRVLGYNETSNDPYGSLCFKAPEIIKRREYDFKIDVWSFGVTLYFMMFKQLPFDKGDKNQIKYSIVNDFLNFPISQGFMNNGDNSFLYKLIEECLEKEPKHRPSFNQIIVRYINLYQNCYDFY